MEPAHAAAAQLSAVYRADPWEVREFHCLEIASENFLATYTLSQGPRVTRRATLWRRSAEGWKIVYHQGTLVQAAAV